MKNSYVALIFALYCVVLTQATYFTVTDHAYFDISYDGKFKGKVVMALFGEEVPKTVANFKALATTGVEGKRYGGTSFHRVIPNFMLQGGDVVSGNGLGSISIYGQSFADESFAIEHRMGGMLSMANSGKNTNGCQFFITTVPTPWLNKKHVVFGKVVEGWNIIQELGNVPTDENDKPFRSIVIEKAGVLPLESTYQLSDDPHE